jgi:hypothetical protein
MATAAVVEAAAAGRVTSGADAWFTGRLRSRCGRCKEVSGWSDGGAAAVGGDDRAGDVAGLRGGEEGDDVGDLPGLGGAAEQGGAAEGSD